MRHSGDERKGTKRYSCMKGLTVKYRPMSLLATLALLGSATACGTNGQATQTTDTITAGNGACSVARQQLKASHASLHVANTGSTATDVAVYGETVSGQFKVLKGRARGVQPGGSATIQTQLQQGQYQVVCTPAGGQPTTTSLRAVMLLEGSSGSDHSYDAQFQFQVTPQGQVSAVPDMSVKAGDIVNLEVFNHTRNEYKLVVTNSQQQQMGGLIAPSMDLGQTNMEIDEPGSYTVKVYAAGPNAAPQTFPLTVTK